MPDFDETLADFGALIELLEEAIDAGLADGATLLTTAGQATDAYHGVTGATRSGTVAFSVTPKDDGVTAFTEALQAVERDNPGHGFITTADERADADTRLILFTVPSDYIQELENEGAGAKAFLGPLMDTHGPQLHQAVEARVREVVE